TRKRGDFVKVYASAPASDIPDEHGARLAIIDPKFAHSAKDQQSQAMRKAKEILESRGTSPRIFKNTLIFLAPDAQRLQELGHAVRFSLAWKSIWDDRDELNLDTFQRKQAETKKGNAESTVAARIPEA